MIDSGAEFSDAIKILVDLYPFGTGNRTEVEEKIDFSADFIRQSELCNDLLALVEEAEKEFAEGNYEKANKILDQAVESCKDLVGGSKFKLFKKERIDNFKKYLIVVEIIGAIFVFSALYSYYRRRKFKNQKIK